MVIDARVRAMIEAHGPERVCQVLGPLLTDARRARIEAVLAARLTSVTAVMEDTYDPHNAAAAIRTSEALGLTALHAIEPAAGFVAKGITRGSHRWLDLQRWPSPAAAAAALRARGFRLFATLPDASHDLDTVPVDAPVAVWFGNEHAGLSAAAVAACDGAISIPMWGFTESYNVSVSVALAISRVVARRREHLGRTGDLRVEEASALRAVWFAAKLPAAAGILERALGGAVADPTRPL